MDDDKLHEFISSAVGARHAPEPGGLTSRMLAACWPGGLDDRSERAALEWVRRWHPRGAVAAMPYCSCPTGRCAVCN
jgi:hypothetical protein